MQRKRKPTITDVARLAGVNRVTVSVALNGASHGGTRISEATRQRVLDAARELGYTPNALALALRGQKTNIIGFYTGYESINAHDPFTATVINGLQQGCRVHHQDLLIFGSFERQTVDDIYSSLAGGRIDGLILLPTPKSPIMDKLIDSHLPIVCVSNTLPQHPSVVVDDRAGSRLLAEHLAAKGHQRIYYRADAEPHTSTVRRREAFLAAAAELGMQVTVDAESISGYITTTEIELFTQTPHDQRPTAVASWVDSHAYYFVEDCENLGIRIPDDLAVVGFDGVTKGPRPAYRLTTIRAPWQEVAATAVDMLMEMIDGGTVEREVILPVELFVGDTT